MKAALTTVSTLLLLTAGCTGDSNPNVTRARVAIKQLGEAAAFYNNNHGTWPDSLDILTQPQTGGGNALLDAHALQDPWGRAYQYDSLTKNPETGLPLIWSEGPNPGEPGSKIANWNSGD